MSTTSGPMVPGSTGKSSDLPSGSLRVAFLSAMVFPLGGAQAGNDRLQVGRVVVAAPDDDVPQVVVRQIKERRELGIVGMPEEIARKHDIELEQPAAASPLQLLAFETVHQTARFTKSSLM